MLDSSRNEEHFLGADILRGIAILSVVLYHAFGRLYGFYLPWNGYWRDFHNSPNPQLVFFYPVSFGWAGVALFFVLSGFCIHTSFLRSRRFTNAQFFWQRFWRIYPAYLLAMVAFACMGRLKLASPGGLKQLLSHVLLIHNFHPSSLHGINPSFWSIATEVQLYLLFPLLLLLRRRWGMGACLAVTFAAGLAGRGMAVALWGLPEHVISPAFSWPITTWFDWTLGAYVAERALQQKNAFGRHALWLALIVPAFVLSTLCKPLTIFSFTLAATGSAVVLDLMVRARFRGNFVLTGLAFVGLISYSLYLWHQPLLSRFPVWFGRLAAPPWAASIATPLAIGLLSWVSYRFIERQGSKLGKALWGRMASPARSVPRGVMPTSSQSR
jgi:peptidoglycan/LPS O-acetylase OafA/YrhL